MSNLRKSREVGDREARWSFLEKKRANTIITRGPRHHPRERQKERRAGERRGGTDEAQEDGKGFVCGAGEELRRRGRMGRG